MLCLLSELLPAHSSLGIHTYVYVCVYYIFLNFYLLLFVISYSGCQCFVLLVIHSHLYGFLLTLFNSYKHTLQAVLAGGIFTPQCFRAILYTSIFYKFLIHFFIFPREYFVSNFCCQQLLKNCC